MTEPERQLPFDGAGLPTPCYVLDRAALDRNLAVVDRVRREGGVEVLAALKACAMWSIFPDLAAHSDGAAASSVAEARLVAEEYGTAAHTFMPALTAADAEEVMRYSSHLIFNSREQFDRFGPSALLRGISCGLRVNPGYSPVVTALYNPALPGSRLGMGPGELPALPPGVDGLHFHVLCESRPEHLRRALEAFEERFGHLIPQLRWLNMGGGHLFTHAEYDVGALIALLGELHVRWPHLRLILEPGSAFTWRTGWLVASVADVVRRDGIPTAMLDASFACHMPDCLEMPYKPTVVGAHEPAEGEERWRLGGNSCLAGDWMGDWAFDRAPRTGDRLFFEDMIHYTMVKTTMFNGVRHPSIAILERDGSLRVVRRFTYEDYRSRLS